MIDVINVQALAGEQSCATTIEKEKVIYVSLSLTKVLWLFANPFILTVACNFPDAIAIHI